MKTLRETYGAETKFTQSLASDITSLNKINSLVGLPQVVKATNEFGIPGGSIDVVGYTARGEVIVYEHQDISGRADQTHVAKTSHYALVMKNKGHKVLGTILLCESIDQIFLDNFKEHRWSYERRPSYMGHFNIHAVKSQWQDDGTYDPILFEESNTRQAQETVLDTYADFVKIYAAEWAIQREERNGSAITLWHRISELGNNYMAYIHTLSNTIKIGLHCEPKRIVTEDEKNLLKEIAPSEWEFRDSAKMKATIELTLPIDSDPETWANATETLKRNIRKRLTL